MGLRGMRVVGKDGDTSEVHETVNVRCPLKTCSLHNDGANIVVTLELVHEDEMGIGYAGACNTCGSEVTVHYSKGES